MFSKNKEFRFFIISFCALCLSACSMGAFSGEQVDKKVLDQANYRKINTSCSGMDLSSANITVPVFRQLLDCFNSNEAMPQTASFVRSVSDSQLEPIVTAVNKYFLSDKWLYKLEATYNTLDGRGDISAALSSFGRIIENQDFVTNLIALIRNGYFSNNGKNKQALLRSLELLSAKITDSRISSVLDKAMVASSSKAFIELQQRLSTVASDRSLRDVAVGLLDYVSLAPSKNRVLVKELLQLYADNKFDPFIDSLVPRDDQQFKQSISNIANLFTAALSENGAILNRVSSLFSALSEPVSCFKNSRNITDPLGVILEQMSAVKSGNAASFLQMETTLNIAIADPFCNFPISFYDDFPAFQKLAGLGGAEGTVDVVKAFEKAKLSPVFRKLMADSVALKALQPALVEITKRGAWEDVLLLATLLKFENGDEIKSAVKFILEEKEELNGASIYDTYFDAIAVTNPVHLEGLLRGLGKFFKANDNLLLEVSTILRRVFYANNVHPGFDILRQFLSDASKNEQLFNTVFEVVGSSSFHNAITEIAEMSREKDGRLKDLVGSLVLLFHRFAAGGQTKIIEAHAPDITLANARWHNYGKDDLFTPIDQFGVCRNINLSLRIDQAILNEGNPKLDSDHRYERHLDSIEECLSSSGSHADLAQTLRFLRSSRMPNDASFLTLPVKWVSSLELSQPETKFFVERVLAAKPEISRVSKLLPVFVSKEESVFEPLIKIAEPFEHDDEAKNGLTYVENWLASVLEQNDFMSLLGYVHHEVLDPRPTGSVEVARSRDEYDRGRILRWIENKECQYLPEDPEMRELAKQKRLAEITEEYEKAVTNSSEVASVESGIPIYRAKRSWTLAEFKSEIGEILNALSVRDKNNGFPAVRALINFTKNFAKPRDVTRKQKYDWQFLHKWLLQRSNDYRAVSFVYPGEDGNFHQRRVRLASTLDRLEILLLAIYEKGEISLASSILDPLVTAWGDEWEHDYESLPPEIKKQYPKNGKRRPRTLAEAVEGIESIVLSMDQPDDSGEPPIVQYPVFTACQQKADPTDSPDVQEMELFEPLSPGGAPTEITKLQAAFYNIRQSISVLRENLPGATGPNAGGLTLIRDLLWELNNNQKYDPKSGISSDNLSLVTNFVRLGTLRQVARLLIGISPEDKTFQNFVRTLVDATNSQDGERLFADLLEHDPKHELALGLSERLFHLSENPTTREHLKTIGFNGILALDSVMREQGISALLDALIRSIRPLLSTPKQLHVLQRNVPNLIEFLAVERVAELITVLHQNQNLEGKDLLRDLVNKTADDKLLLQSLIQILTPLDDDKYEMQWRLFRDRFEAATGSPKFKELKFDLLMHQFLVFFDSPYSDVQARVAQNLIRNFASTLRSGDLQQLILLAAKEPDGVNKMLSTAARYTEEGSVDYLLEVLKKYFQ